MSLLDVIDKMAKHNPVEFVAPVPEAQRVRVFSWQDGIPYWFWVSPVRPGWWHLDPRTSTARPAKLAAAHEFIPILEQLPRFYVIALFPLSEWTWLCVPYNASDAEQRGWPQGQPRELHIVRHRLESLDMATARDLAGVLLYDDLDCRLSDPPSSSDRHNAQGIVQVRKEELQREEEERRRAAQRMTVEGEMEYRLGLAGASLDSWRQSGEGYQVSWSFNNATHTMKVARNLTIESAGICLHGTSSTHDLTTIVSTMEEARTRRRFDLDEEMHL